MKPATLKSMKNLSGVFGGTLKERRAIARGIKAENSEFGPGFIAEFRQSIPTRDRNGKPQDLIKVFRNNRFLVQLYKNGDWLRLSIKSHRLQSRERLLGGQYHLGRTNENKVRGWFCKF